MGYIHSILLLPYLWGFKRLTDAFIGPSSLIKILKTIPEYLFSNKTTTNKNNYFMKFCIFSCDIGDGSQMKLRSNLYLDTTVIEKTFNWDETGLVLSRNYENPAGKNVDTDGYGDGAVTNLVLGGRLQWTRKFCLELGNLLAGFHKHFTHFPYTSGLCNMHTHTSNGVSNPVCDSEMKAWLHHSFKFSRKPCTHFSISLFAEKTEINLKFKTYKMQRIHILNSHHFNNRKYFPFKLFI